MVINDTHSLCVKQRLKFNHYQPFYKYSHEELILNKK